MTTLPRALTLIAILIAAPACSKKADDGPAPAADATSVTPDPTPVAADAAVVAVAADAAAIAEPDAAVATTAEPTAPVADDAPTNLKLLSKKWSRARVERYMKTFNKALGAECEYCHVDKKDYASDANKLKRSARRMISLTRTLNRTYFGGKRKVSCRTCHKGKKKPE